MNNFWFITDENDENTRLDNYLSELFDNFSRSHFQKMIKNNEVLINNKPTKPSYKVKLGDKIAIESIEKDNNIYPQNISLEIVWEDENMAVINKPSGMLTHPTELEKENTLVNALLYKYGENLSDLNGYFRRGIVHRLDRNTSGLLMIAKNNKTHEALTDQFRAISSPLEEQSEPLKCSKTCEPVGAAKRVREGRVRGTSRTLTKKYLAVVKGKLKEDEGIIDFQIGRNPHNPSKMAVVEDGKPSITDYKVIERFKDTTYIELDLKTGRTHQIRVHLSYIGHPIINDTLYGAGQYKVKTQEQVLQAYKLAFKQPFSDNIIELEIEPDEKIQKVLNYLRSET